MSQPDSATLLLMASHFPSELMPLIFQLRILQDLLLLRALMKREASKGAQHPSQIEKK
jgi:hypothetical protein